MMVVPVHTVFVCSSDFFLKVHNTIKIDICNKNIISEFKQDLRICLKDYVKIFHESSTHTKIAIPPTKMLQLL